MKKIMTVLGPVAPEELGFTSMHDHIMLDMSVWMRNYGAQIPDYIPVSWNDPVSLENIGFLTKNWFLVRDNVVFDDEELMTAEVADFKAAGGAAILEMSCLGLRTNLPAIQRISQKTGVHVVATTGLYVEDAWPDYMREMTSKQIAALLVKEIEEGIEDIGIKAGHIGELGIVNLSERDVRLLKAGARASMETGLSVSVHLSGVQSGGAHGLRVVDILTKEGMDSEWIIICHVDGFIVERNVRVLVHNPDRWGLQLDYAKGLLDRGVNISFDCFGHWADQELRGRVITTDWQRIAGIVALTSAGYGSQIVLGTDTCMKIELRRYGGGGYSRLLNYTVPTLKAHGISDYDIRLMTIENPARLLAR